MTGTKLGPFTLLEKLGEGGMGVVYKARDTRLDRLVAIKLLPESLAADPGRRARFVQEAKAASALNHPNIVTIHEIGEHEGHHYIVMECLEGKPLSEAIPAQGMRLTDALRAAVQIADALSAAHAAGLVHRDLKPGNIMIDAQGRAKVLDFGLAKLTTPAGPEDATRTLALGAQTEAGTIVGSVPYMSPEQAEGRPVDARSDIFSFGAVLYEMVTGKRAFQGESRIQTLAAVVRDDPTPASQIASSVPSELERVISRCLRKDVAKRSQNMPDVKLALEELRDDSESGRSSQTVPSLPAKRSRWLWPAVTLAGVLLIAAVVVGWNALRRGPAATAPAQLTRLTPDDGYSYRTPMLSPDGKFVATISARGGSTEQVWLQQVGSNDLIQVTHAAAGVQGVEFFPDGKRLLVTTRRDAAGENSLEVTPMLGGAPRAVSRQNNFAPAGLSPDGKLAAYFEGARPYRLMLIPVEGGSPRVLEKWSLTQGLFFNLAFRWLPGSRSLLVAGSLRRDSTSLDDWEWFVLPIDGGDPVATGAGPVLRLAGLGPGAGNVSLADRLLFGAVKDGRTNVWQIRFDPASKKVAGAPEQLTYGTEVEFPVSQSAAGLLAIESTKRRSDLYFLPTDSATGQASGPARRLSQDGRQKNPWLYGGGGGDPGSLYFVVFAADRKISLSGHALDLATGQQRLVLDQVDIMTPMVISFDGRQVAFSRPDGDTFSVSLGAVGAPVAAARALCQKCGRAVGFSRDGRYLLVNRGSLVKPSPAYRGGVDLLEVATGKVTPWIEPDPEPASGSVTTGGLFGDEWVLLITGNDPKAQRTYLVPWATKPVPRPEWIEITLPTGSSFNRTGAPYVYDMVLGSDRMVGMRFDPRLRRLTEPFPIRFVPGSVAIARDDNFWTRGSGIAFVHRETNATAWLMNAPE